MWPKSCRMFGGYVLGMCVLISGLFVGYLGSARGENRSVHCKTAVLEHCNETPAQLLYWDWRELDDQCMRHQCMHVQDEHSTIWDWDLGEQLQQNHFSTFKRSSRDKHPDYLNRHAAIMELEDVGADIGGSRLFPWPWRSHLVDHTQHYDQAKIRSSILRKVRPDTKCSGGGTLKWQRRYGACAFENGTDDLHQARSDDRGCDDLDEHRDCRPEEDEAAGEAAGSSI